MTRRIPRLFVVVATLAFCAMLLHQADAQSDRYLTADELRATFSDRQAEGIEASWRECYSADGTFSGVYNGYRQKGTWEIGEDETSAYVRYVYSRGGDIYNSRIKLVTEETVEYFELDGAPKGHTARLGGC